MHCTYVRIVPVLLGLVLALTACAGRELVEPDDSFRLERNTEFDGGTLRFFVTLEDGTVASVNTDDDLIEVLPGATPMPDHRARALTFFKVRKEGTSLSHALLSWDPDDPADYLVFGWWAEFVGQSPPVLSLADSRAVRACRRPGARPWNRAPELPTEGTAAYLGPAGGLYRYVPGAGPGEDLDNIVLEEYQGTIVLTADFFDGTVKGCIGCIGDLVTRRAHFGVILGQEVAAPQDTARDYELHLPSAIIRDERPFRARQGGPETPGADRNPVRGALGAALFSSRRDSGGNPRLAARFQRRRIRAERRRQGRILRVVPGPERTLQGRRSIGVRFRSAAALRPETDAFSHRRRPGRLVNSRLGISRVRERAVRALGTARSRLPSRGNYRSPSSGGEVKPQPMGILSCNRPLAPCRHLRAPHAPHGARSKNLSRVAIMQFAALPDRTAEYPSRGPRRSSAGRSSRA